MIRRERHAEYFVRLLVENEELPHFFTGWYYQQRVYNIIEGHRVHRFLEDVADLELHRLLVHESHYIVRLFIFKEEFVLVDLNDHVLLYFFVLTKARRAAGVSAVCLRGVKLALDAPLALCYLGYNLAVI